MLRRWSLVVVACEAVIAFGCNGAGKEDPATSTSASAVAVSAPVPQPPASAPVNATPLSAASVAAYVNPRKLPAYNGPTGSIEGHVSIVGDPSPDAPAYDYRKCPQARETYAKLFREGAPDATGARPLADALVAVTGYEGFYLPEGNEVRAITIDKCAFSARTIDMTIGQRLDITNNTDLLVAPAFSQSPAPALMVAAPHRDAVRLYPQKPRYDTLIDRMSASFLKADVYVLLFPLHTVTGLDGHYRIDGVPVGKMTVNARLAPIQRETSKSVDVLANVVTTVDLQLAYKAKPDAGPPQVAAVDGGVSPQSLVK
jgi:hypothetical protein